jgi:hypothetical protein
MNKRLRAQTRRGAAAVFGVAAVMAKISLSMAKEKKQHLKAGRNQQNVAHGEIIAIENIEDQQRRRRRRHGGQMASIEIIRRNHQSKVSNVYQRNIRRRKAASSKAK